MPIQWMFDGERLVACDELGQALRTWSAEAPLGFALATVLNSAPESISRVLLWPWWPAPADLDQ